MHSLFFDALKPNGNLICHPSAEKHCFSKQNQSIVMIIVFKKGVDGR